MNKILKIFDERFVADLFREKVLPLYPGFKEIKKIKIIPHKKNIWEKTYHVVTEFQTTFITLEKKERKLSLFCSAHSEEPRLNVYQGLNFLWQNNFGRGYLTIPHPLFYEENLQAVFYRGLKGSNLLHYIKKNDQENIAAIVSKTAAWLAKLHKTSISGAENFINPENNRLSTVLPGVKFILCRIQNNYNFYYEPIKKIYEDLIRKEESFFNSANRRWLVHGDLHPENIIKVSRRKLGVIDFTDLCLSDFARDLGTFSQQLEYMCRRKINETNYPEKIKNFFLENYLNNAKIKLDESLKGRINAYYHWTAIRTATFLLLKDEPRPERAKPLIEAALAHFK